MKRRTFLLLLTVVFASVWTTGKVLAAEIVMWLWRSEPATLELLKHVAMPELKAKYDIDFKVETLSGAAQNRERLVIAFAGGVAPDIVISGGQEAGVFAHRGFTIPLDRFLADWDERADIPPPAWAAVTYRGEIYGVPFWMSPRGFAVNTRMFAEAGLDGQSPPQTWETFLETVPKLNRAEGDRLIQSGLQVSLAGNEVFESFYRLLQQNGGRILNDDWTEPNLHDPRATEALEFLLEVHRAARPSHLTAGNLTVPNGGAAMNWMFNDGAMGSLAASNPDLARDVEVHLNLGRVRRVSTVYFNSLGITTASRDPESAWQVIDYLTAPALHLRFTRTIDSLPPRLSLVGQVLADHIPKADRFMRLLEYAHVIEAHPSYFDLREVAGQQLAAALREEIPAKAALERAAELWRPLLALD